MSAPQKSSAQFLVSLVVISFKIEYLIKTLDIHHTFAKDQLKLEHKSISNRLQIDSIKIQIESVILNMVKVNSNLVSHAGDEQYFVGLDLSWKRILQAHKSRQRREA